MTCDGSPSCCRCIGWVLMRFAAAGRVVTFPGPQGPQEAAAVVKALSNQPFEPAGGRTLVCKFAKWVPEPGAPQEDPQVGNCSKRLCVELYCCTPQSLQLNDHCEMCLITAGVTGVVCCSDNVAGRVCDVSAAHCTDSSSGPGRAWQGVGMGGDHPWPTTWQQQQVQGCCTPHIDTPYCRTRAGPHLTNTLPLPFANTPFSCSPSTLQLPAPQKRQTSLAYTSCMTSSQSRRSSSCCQLLTSSPGCSCQSGGCSTMGTGSSTPHVGWT